MVVASSAGTAMGIAIAVAESATTEIEIVSGMEFRRLHQRMCH
jgi:hypothetical protein